jgi:hypothetical protein
MDGLSNAGYDLAQNSWFTVLGRGAAIAALGLLGWTLVSIISLQSDVRVLSAELNSWAPTRYTAGDAMRDFQLRDLKIESLASRLSELEHEVRSNKIEVQQQLPKHR